MKKLILNSFVSSLVFFGVGFFVIKGFAALSTATSGTPLTAGSWNDMVSNFFWGSGSGGIYYNGNVGIGTTSPSEKLEVNGLIKSTSGGVKFPDSSIQATANHTFNCVGPTYTYYLGTTGPYGPECVLRSQCPSGYESFGCTKTDAPSAHANGYDYSWQFINQVRGTAPTGTTQGCTWWTTFPDAASATSFCTNGNYHIMSKCCKIN